MTREELSGTVYFKLRAFYDALNASKVEEEIMADVDKYVNTALSERHGRLVEAVREWMVRLAAMDIDDKHSCFSECVLAKECDEDSGNECLLAARLKAALEEEER